MHYEHTEDPDARHDDRLRGDGGNRRDGAGRRRGQAERPLRQTSSCKYSDLDLNSAAGNKVLYARLSAAAERACGNAPSARDLKRQAQYRACYDSALNRAVDKIGSRELQALHTSRRSATTWAERSGRVIDSGRARKDATRPVSTASIDDARHRKHHLEAFDAQRPRARWRGTRSGNSVRIETPLTHPAQSQVARGFGPVIIGPAVKPLRQRAELARHPR